jgi:hypothetical protein
MVEAPANSMRLRNAVEIETTTAALIWVVSAVSRDTSSPLLAESKNAGDSDVRCENTSRRRSATVRSPSVVTR